MGILDYKLDQLKELLSAWTVKTEHGMLELAQLLGILENHTRCARWARCCFYSLQNEMRRILHGRFCVVERIMKRAGKGRYYSQLLPAQLSSRISVLIARDKAQLLWSTKQKFKITPPTVVELENSPPLRYD